MGFWDYFNPLFLVQQQLNRIEERQIKMAIDFSTIDQKVTELGAAITAGFEGIGKEVLETATLVRDLRDKIGTGIDEATIQAHLEQIAAALQGAADSASSKSAEVAASLDAIQNPPTP